MNHTKQVHQIHTIFMVYGAEAVLPSDIEYDSPHVRAYAEEAAEESRKDDIDGK